MLENRAAELKPQLSLRDSDKKIVWRNAAQGYQVTPGQDVRAEMEAPAGADWFVSVGALGGSGGYVLLVTRE